MVENNIELKKNRFSCMQLYSDKFQYDMSHFTGFTSIFYHHVSYDFRNNLFWQMKVLTLNVSKEVWYFKHIFRYSYAVYEALLVQILVEYLNLTHKQKIKIVVFRNTATRGYNGLMVYNYLFIWVCGTCYHFLRLLSIINIGWNSSCWWKYYYVFSIVWW